MGKIVIKRTSNDGYHFTIVANNGQVVGVSQTYKSLKSAKSGIESVKRNRNSRVEDQTVPDYEELGFPKWQIFNDAAGEFRFRLVAMNGETVPYDEPFSNGAMWPGDIDNLDAEEVANCQCILEITIQD